MQKAALYAKLDVFFNHPLTLYLIRVLLLGFYAGFVSLFAIKGLSLFFTPDLPWILRTGDAILKDAVIPATDIFSWTHPDKPIVVYQWLFELIVSFMNHYVGMVNVIKIGIITSLVVYVIIPTLIHLERGGKLLVVTPILGLTMFMNTLNLSMRPMLMSVTFCLFLCWLLHDARRGQLKTWVLYVAFAIIGIIWGNMHTGITMGLLSITLYAIGDWLESTNIYNFTPVSPGLEGHPLSLKTYGKAFLCIFAGSLVNPYGIGIYTYLAWLSGQTYLNQNIQELHSLNFHFPAPMSLLLLFVIFMLLMTRARRYLSAHSLLHLLVFSIINFGVSRVIVWSSLYYALFLPVAIQHLINERGPNSWVNKLTESFDLYTFLIGSSIPYIVGICLFLLPSFSQIEMFQYRNGACEPLLKGLRTYTTELALSSDRVFEDAMTGSCSIYQNPNRKVFIDTRFDFFGQDFTKETAGILAAGKGWEAAVEKRGVNTYILPQGAPLAKVLKTHHQYNPEQYKLIYEDTALVIYRNH